MPEAGKCIRMTSGQPRVWLLVPPGSPPSAPALHSKATNKPFALLQSLEPPRGPDYFPMERFRGYRPPPPSNCWPESGRTRYNVPDGYGRNRPNRDDGGDSGGDVNSFSSENGDCNRRASPAFGGQRWQSQGGGVAAGILRSGTRAQASTGNPSLRCETGTPDSAGLLSPPLTTMTPPPQQGISLFGGKMYATPGSGRRQSSVLRPLDFTPAYKGHSGESRGSTSNQSGCAESVGVVVGAADGIGPDTGDGIPRFKPLAQQTPEEEKMEEQNHGGQHLNGGVATGLSLAPPPFSGPVASSPLGSTPPAPTPSSRLNSVGSFGQAFTPSPSARSRLPTKTGGEAAGLSSTPMSAGCKRPRTPSLATSLATVPRPGMNTPTGTRSDRTTRKDTQGVRMRIPATTSSRATQERAWGSMGQTDGLASSSNGGRTQCSRQSLSRGQGKGASKGVQVMESGTQKSTVRSSRPKKSAATPSPRGRAGRSKTVAATGNIPGSPASKPRRLTLADFAGADEACFNPGASSQALSVFLERCEARGTIALAMIWADLTTSFSAVTVKSCLPSQRCHRWNCSCGRQPRAYQATAPIIGAIIYIPPSGKGPSLASLSSADSQEDSDFLEGETYLLPLGPCHGEEKETEVAGGYQLPIECQATYAERWQALANLLAMSVKKVAFNAQVTLMPFVAWTRHLDSTSMTASGAPKNRGSDRGVGAVSDGSAALFPGLAVSDLFDPRVAAWMADTGSTDKALEFEALCVRWRVSQADSGDGAAIGEKMSTIVAAVSHAEKCCRRCIALASQLSNELEGENMLAAAHEVEMPAIPVLAGMEVSGVVFLPERVTRFSEALDRHLDGLRSKAVALVGGIDFNLASPEQVAEVLFKRLKLPSPAVKAGSVHASTSAEVLEGLLEKHPVVAPILEFRGVNKLKTTYVDKLAEKAVGAVPTNSAVPASQGMGTMIAAARIHAAWNQTSVRTGRLSCSRPNLQQIPKGSDPLAGVEGVNIRDAFAASKSFTLMAADYSQIEMRVLADACKDPGLASLFASLGTDGSGGGGRGDVYRRLAAQVFGKEESTITDPERTRAKVVCLGIIYGMGTPQVARKLGVTEGQAQGLVRSFLKAFPRIEPFLSTTRRYARETGYVCTLTGRRRHLPEINNSHVAALRAQAERQAVNSVVQGTAADIIKSAMVLVASRLDRWRSGLEAGQECPRLVMQIHDELVFECPAREEDLGRLKALLKQCMEVETPAKLGIKCPLMVNMLVGMSWGSMRRVVVSDDDVDSDDG